MSENSKVYLERRAARKSAFPTKAIVAIVLCLLVAVVALAFTATSDNTGDVCRIDTEALCRVALPDDTPEIVKEYTGFTVSFNPAHHVPNYVAWELTGAEVAGDVPRRSNFRADDAVPGSATLADYRNSGFDRGHMAPAADMKWSIEAMDDSHFLTNMCPQTHQLNGGRWQTLEDKCRQWAARDSAIIIIAGPILSDDNLETIGVSGVTVPDRFFKIVYSPFVEPQRAIAFIMPNFPPIDGLEACATSIDNVEAITGFDFFAELPDELENALEGSANYRDFDRKHR